MTHFIQTTCRVKKSSLCCFDCKVWQKKKRFTESNVVQKSSDCRILMKRRGNMFTNSKRDQHLSPGGSETGVHAPKLSWQTENKQTKRLTDITESQTVQPPVQGIRWKQTQHRRRGSQSLRWTKVWEWMLFHCIISLRHGANIDWPWGKQHQPRARRLPLIAAIWSPEAAMFS